MDRFVNFLKIEIWVTKKALLLQGFKVNIY